jgi:hypothetical protein
MFRSLVFSMFCVLVISGCNCGFHPAYDCASASCADGAVVPFVDASVPSDSGVDDPCPAMSRDQAAEALSGVFGLVGRQPSCSDVSSASASWWGGLEQDGKVVVSSQGACRPNEPMSRAEVVQWVNTLIRATDIYSSRPERPSFGDVRSDAPLFRPLEALLLMGVVECDPDKKYQQDNLFRPDGPADRCFVDQMAQRIKPILERPHLVMVKNSLGGVVPQGAAHQEVATYLAFGVRRDRPIRGLRIMNDLEGEFDVPEMPQVVSSVDLICGKLFSASFFSLGVIDFPPISECFREDRLPIVMTLAFNTWSQTVFRSATSGLQFRLGLVGSEFPVERQVTYAYTYRKTVPVIRRASVDPMPLAEGTNVLFPLEICADSHGNMSVCRLAFDVVGSGKSGTCSSVRLERHGSIVSQASPSSLVAGGLVPVSVAFESEAVVMAGTCERFDLKAECSGFGSGEMLGTLVWSKDEDWVYAKPKTSCVFDPADPKACMLDSSDKFFRTVPNGFGILWSDQSADQHKYPLISNGQFVSRGSSDFTTGMGLWLEKVEPHTLTRE